MTAKSGWVSSLSHCYCRSFFVRSPSCTPALIVIVYNLFRRKKKGHEWPRLKIFSAWLLLRQKIRKRWHKSVAYKDAVSRESYCLVPSHLPASVLLKRGPGWNSSGYNSTSSNKERNLYIIFKDYVLTNLQPFINLLKCNVRLFGSKNGFSNFFDFLYLAWLSRYKNTIENNFSHQWRKTSGCRARNVYVWWPESEFPWWQKTDEMTTKMLSSHLRINAAKPKYHIYSIIASIYMQLLIN